MESNSSRNSKVRALKLAIAAFLVCCIAISCSNRKVRFDEDKVVALYPERVRSLFEAVDLDFQGLKKVKSHLLVGDTALACKALCDYYASLGQDHWRVQYVLEKISKYSELLTAEQVLGDTIVNQGRQGTLVRKADGLVDWHDLGPVGDKEWGWFVNRFYFLRPVIEAYHKNGKSAYASYVDRTFRDWIIQNPAPHEKTGNSTWRVLEVGLRIVQIWPTVFYLFQQAEEFEVGTRILFLSSLLEHALYLEKYHWYHHNHSVMEMNGLANIALLWPEFKFSSRWYEHAEKQILDDIEFLVYPDGAEIELTSMYHRVALDHFEEFSALAIRAGKEPDKILSSNLENMWNFLAYTIRPNGTGLLNNDSDLDNNVSRVLQASKRYQRPDWEYVVTNGKEGRPPIKGPSIHFDWAGHAIMRNGWDTNSHWSYFDNGCWGWAHQHEDMLHLSVYAHGRDILVDGGRYWYINPYDRSSKEGRTPHFWRGYFLHSAAHNTLLIDGNGQKPPDDRVKLDKKLEQSLFIDADTYVFAKGTHNDGYWDMEGQVSHSRAVIYFKNKYWIVLDDLQTDRPREVKVLWHFHPDCSVIQSGSSVFSDDPGTGNLRIVPNQGPKWEIEMVRGQETPEIQGWYSERYNSKVPNVAVSYDCQMKESGVVGWLLLPAKGTVEQASLTISSDGAQQIDIEVSIGNKDKDSWTVDLRNGEVRVSP